MCLATNKKLFTMDLINSSNCNNCPSGTEQTSLHMFYQCSYVNPLFQWILRCVLNLCNFKPLSPIRFLYFDNIYNNARQKNICNIFLYIYIISIRRNRKENLRIGNFKHLFIRNLNDYQKFTNPMQNHRGEKLSNDLKNIDMDNIFNL